MKGGKTPLGYTIVEVMIVLAVSGMMFVIAANFINGKQQKTAFSQGVNEMASRIQSTIEQVSDGQYSDIPFNCSANSTPVQITAAVSGKQQGTNSSCVFIGKFFQFYHDNKPEKYEVFSLAGDRSATSLGPDVAPIRSSDGAVDLTIQQTIPQRLEVSDTHVTVVDAAGVTHAHNYGFGFSQSQGTADTEVGTYVSGAQTVNLVYTPALMAGLSEGGAIAAITGKVALANSATFCLTDGTYYAQIGIGDTTTSSNRLGVRVTMKGKTPC